MALIGFGIVAQQARLVEPDGGSLWLALSREVRPMAYVSLRTL